MTELFSVIVPIPGLCASFTWFEWSRVEFQTRRWTNLGSNNVNNAGNKASRTPHFVPFVSDALEIV